AEVGVTLAGGDELAERRAAELRRPVPRAATDRALEADTSRRVFHRAARVILRIVMVLAPLPSVAVHVMKPPGIRIQLAHAVRPALRIVPVPGVERQLFVPVPEAIPGACPAGPAAILPLGFRRQTVLPSFLRAQPVAEIDSVVPGNEHDR